MSQGTLTLKIDSETKKQFNEFCEEVGINMTTAINMYIKKVIRDQKIPFELSLDKPNIETLEVLNDVTEHKNLSRKFKSVKELMEDLNA